MKTEKNEFGFVVRGSAGKSRPVQLLFCFWWARATCDNPCRSILAYSVGTVVAAVVDLYVAVEGYSRQCHSNRIMEESWSVVNKCCCLFCDETSNMAQDTNSWRHLFTHIVRVLSAWALQVIKLSNRDHAKVFKSSFARYELSEKTKI